MLLPCFSLEQRDQRPPSLSPRHWEQYAEPPLSSFSPGALAEITIRVDESDCLSMASCHNQETERFLSTGTMGRRVSFNEAALFDHSKKAQEKGRRLERRLDTHLHYNRTAVCHQRVPTLNCVSLLCFCRVESESAAAGCIKVSCRHKRPILLILLRFSCANTSKGIILRG